MQTEIIYVEMNYKKLQHFIRRLLNHRKDGQLTLLRANKKKKKLTNME